MFMVVEHVRLGEGPVKVGVKWVRRAKRDPRKSKLLKENQFGNLLCSMCLASIINHKLQMINL